MAWRVGGQEHSHHNSQCLKAKARPTMLERNPGMEEEPKEGAEEGREETTSLQYLEVS